MYKPRLHLFGLTALACALLALPALADSQARIVRLSDVQGSVQIDKNAGLGYENAFDNLPVTQGTRLHTRDNARAEIEFEDGSTLRLTPNTTVEFSKLGLTDAGKRISGVNLVQGKAYIDWVGKSGDEFTLSFSQEKVQLSVAPAHFRVATSSTGAELANFKNDLEVVGPSGTVKVPKKKMVTFDVSDDDKSMVAKNFRDDPYDQWDKQSADYHEQYAKNNSTPYGYGASDLGYYGGYSNVPGFGLLWQPFFAGVGWNPYLDGAWAWYPGMGYTWASAYPWGWLPYYYGNWTYAPGYGWGWQPGGFNTWHGGIHYVGAAVAGFHPPVAPTGSVSTAAVGKGGPALTSNSSRGFSPASTVVKSGSVGLGIPRGSYGDLHQLNRQVAKAGFVELRAAPQFAASSPRTGGYSFAGSHAGGSAGGSAPAAPVGHASSGGGGGGSHH
jgi:hypothetical protein